MALITKTLAEVKITLQENPSREFLIEVMSNGVNLSPIVRAMAFAWVSGMSEKDVIRISKIAVRAIEYIEHEDFEGLQMFMDAMGVPGKFIEIVAKYVQHYTQHE